MDESCVVWVHVYDKDGLQSASRLRDFATRDQAEKFVTRVFKAFERDEDEELRLEQERDLE